MASRADYVWGAGGVVVVGTRGYDGIEGGVYDAAPMICEQGLHSCEENEGEETGHWSVCGTRWKASLDSWVARHMGLGGRRWVGLMEEVGRTTSIWWIAAKVEAGRVRVCFVSWGLSAIAAALVAGIRFRFYAC